MLFPESNYAVPLKHPQMMTYETIHKLHIVKMLLKRVDSLTPKVKMATVANWTNKTATKQFKNIIRQTITAGIKQSLSCTCQSEDETESKEIRIGRQELDAHAEMFSEIVSHGVAQQLINVSTVASSHTART